jgi:hypothetical protein
MKRKSTDVCYKCGNTGHWAHECELSIDAHYQRPGKVAKQKIFLNVPYREKDEAKYHGAKWDAGAKKWFVFERVPEALKRFAPKPTYVFVKPEESIDSLCRYCYFSFDEGLIKSKSDPKACIYCFEKKQPPQCRECNKFLVSDCFGRPNVDYDPEDDPSICIIHDCVGTPLMYGDTCTTCQAVRRLVSGPSREEFEYVVNSHGFTQDVVKAAMENSLPGTLPDLLTLRIVHDRIEGFKLQKKLHEAAVKELSAEFPEFEVIPDDLFYPHNKDTKRGVPAHDYGLHFKIGKASDDTRIKDFIVKMGTVMIPINGSVCEETPGYLPRVFKELSKKNKPEPLILFGRGEGEYILIDTENRGGYMLEQGFKGYIKLD